MDAILGFFDRTRTPVSGDMLGAMAARLSHRCHTGIKLWHDDNVGLGSCAVSIVVDSEPPGPALDKGVRVAADARIDNAEDLATALGLGDRRDIQIEMLLSAAYSRWGPSCVSHLVGDFAFAIWDAKKQLLFCARDRFGVRPFYYHLSSTSFGFATEIEALLTIPVLSGQIDEWKIAEMLTGNVVDKEATFYKAIRRLPAAHTLTVSTRDAHIDRYWFPEKTPELHLSSDDEYETTFRSLFSEAVSTHLRDVPVPAVQLSGGLDSSSIACLSHHLRKGGPGSVSSIQTFSAIYPELPDCDETPFIEAVVSRGQFKPHFVRPTLYSPLAERHGRRLGLAEPLYWPTWPMESAIFGAANEEGVKVLLSGHGGDHVLAAQPDGYYPDLLRTGRWLSLAGEIHAVAGARNSTVRHLLWQEALKPILLSVAPSPMLLMYRNMRGARTRIAQELHPALERRLSFKQKIQTSLAVDERKQRTARGAHASLLDHTQTQYGFERLNLVSAHYNLDLRHPFWHGPLVDFCLGIPRRQLYSGSITRGLLRRSLSELLPPMVRDRQTKAFFNSLLTHTLWQHESEALKTLTANPEPIEEWVDVSHLRRAYEQFVLSPQTSFREARLLLAALTLAQWRTER